MISSTICSTIVSCRVGRVGSVRSGQAGQSSQSGLSGPTDRPGAWAIVVTFLGHDTCCRVESSGCHILKTRFDKTNYPGRWACRFLCYCNASWTWIFRQGRWVCRFHCYCNTSWTLPLPENRRDISWARHMLSSRVFRMSHPEDSIRQDELPRPVGMQVPLLLQCLLDLDLSSGPVGMQVPLLLQYLLDPSWIPTTM